MGLDMYLYRVPRTKALMTGRDFRAIRAAEEWFDYMKRSDKYRDCTFGEWCGISEDELPSQKFIERFRPYLTEKYYVWDVDKTYPEKMIAENIGYWRKANQVHGWFVENIQDGVDDCRIHTECTESALKDLLLLCNVILEASEEGVCKISLAEKLLPVCEGFFFGSYEYDQYYLESIRNTVDIIKNALETTDFETQAIYYLSSW